MTPEQLTSFRSLGDPLADAAVAALTRKPGPNETVLDLVRAGAREGNRALAAFVDATHTRPAWADYDAMELGRRAAVRHAPLTFLVLLTDGLIESFAIPHEAQVLVRTGRLNRDAVSRLYETAAMVRDLLLERGPRIGEEGHAALLKVRLLHAYVRRYTVKTPGWDSTIHGVPVNQTDMLATLMMFSLVLARGIERLGGTLSDAEKDSWCHLWRYAGFMLGVDEDKLFTDRHDEAATYAVMRAHQYDPDDNSRSLSSSVLEALSGQPPFYLPQSVLSAMTRFLLGDPLADRFALPRSRRWAAAIDAFVFANRRVDWATRTVPFGRDVAERGGHAFVEVHRWRAIKRLTLLPYVFRTIEAR